VQFQHIIIARIVTIHLLESTFSLELIFFMFWKKIQCCLFRVGAYVEPKFWNCLAFLRNILLFEVGFGNQQESSKIFIPIRFEVRVTRRRIARRCRQMQVSSNFFCITLNRALFWLSDPPKSIICFWKTMQHFVDNQKSRWCIHDATPAIFWIHVRFVVFAT